MEQKVFAGTDQDHRWRTPIDPNKPQEISNSKRTKNDVLKKVRDDNFALNLRLNDVTEQNNTLNSKNNELEEQVGSLLEDIKTLKSQLNKAKKEAEDVIKATTPKKKNSVSRKKTSGTSICKSTARVRRKTK